MLVYCISYLLPKKEKKKKQRRKIVFDILGPIKCLINCLNENSVNLGNLERAQIKNMPSLQTALPPELANNAIRVSTKLLFFSCDTNFDVLIHIHVFFFFLFYL